jgi:hypothetical protein
MKIKHIHANVGVFNGTLFFVVDGRLLNVRVGTPNYNDYNEWRLSEFTLSTEPYNPEDNTVELTPYNIEDIEIDESGLRMLEYGTKLSDINYKFEDGEAEKCKAEFPDINLYIAGVMYSDKVGMSFYIEEIDVWLYPEDRVKERESIFQKIFFPILEGFQKEYNPNYAQKIYI